MEAGQVDVLMNVTNVKINGWFCHAKFGHSHSVISFLPLKYVQSA